ncbi:HAMP domain-containing sensor histidine kinase [Roseateles asaccharophilus]|uniref:Signal transduction histidine kinase n=1 Tax=Roseateles asaccharophilus TaxID=582607 RepID=A0ABU2A2U3_9BURK|nr:HAMP domain-containing sensor histidine kinase [Roseateles asaccharophilus]MDR7331355.1 signal transduction histidine kinase [Roseateles asaccharophilus]
MNISTFVAAAAHDMKNSVSVIAAYLEDALQQLARMDATPSSGAALSTAQALYETQRVNGNLVQLMAIYKLEEGMYPFEPAEVALDEFAAELLERVRPLARLKGLDVSCQTEDGLEAWVFDHDLIGSVVTQSMFNAVRYAGHAVRLSLRVRDGCLEIEVADDGEGFPEFMLEQGFPSRQGIDVRTGSTGLGLFFSRLAAGLHRHGERSGSTRIANGGELGGGCFVVMLP